jgi:5'-deoxynucleotidase YfbR-like HD superfamily hydrolase
MIPFNRDSWASVIKAASSDVRRLDHVVRFSSIPVAVSETVSAHSFWVCLYAVMIHRRLVAAFPGDEALGVEELSGFPEHSILLHAMTHDLPECVTGDVVRTFKYSSADLKSEIDAAEEAMTERLPEELRSILEEVGESLGDGRRGEYVKAVVKAADFMSLFEYMNREWNRGNKEVTPFIARMVRDLEIQANAVLSAGKAKNPAWWRLALSQLYDSMAAQAYREPSMEVV